MRKELWYLPIINKNGIRNNAQSGSTYGASAEGCDMLGAVGYCDYKADHCYINGILVYAINFPIALSKSCYARYIFSHNNEIITETYKVP